MKFQKNRKSSRPTHHTGLRSVWAYFPFRTFQCSMINQIKCSMFWSFFQIQNMTAVCNWWKVTTQRMFSDANILCSWWEFASFYCSQICPPGANSWCKFLVQHHSNETFWRKPENVSGERRLVCAIKRVPQCTQPINKKTFYIILLLHSFNLVNFN